LTTNFRQKDSRTDTYYVKVVISQGHLKIGKCIKKIWVKNEEIFQKK